MSSVVGLIAGISGEALAREIKKRNHKVAIIGGKSSESGMDIADFVLVTDLDNHQEILNFLIKHDINKVIFGTGHIKAFYLAEYLHSKQIKISIDPKISLVAKDKFLYKELLISLGFTTPKQFFIKSNEKFDIRKVSGYVDLPCVIKSTTEACYPKKINKYSEMEDAVKNIQNLGTDILLEDYIEGVDTTIPFISNYDNVKAVMVSYYSKAKECKLKGFDKFFNVKLDKKTEEELLRYSEEVVDKTSIIGVGRLDVIVKNNKFYVLECNSVMVTGIHANQIEYGIEFLSKENVNFASLLIDNAFLIFKHK